MSKFYCYGNYSNDIALRNRQIIYLYYVEDLTRGEIAEIVGLQPTTISTYANKYRELLEEAENLFTTKVNEKSLDMMQDYSNRLFAKTKDTNKFYLLRIKNLNTNELITSKIGTTTKPINTRVSQIRREYERIYGCNIEIEIKRVYDCKSITPIFFESFFRAEYILKYGEHYVENDRFEDTEFDYEDADSLYKSLIKRLEKNALI